VLTIEFLKSGGLGYYSYNKEILISFQLIKNLVCMISAQTQILNMTIIHRSVPKIFNFKYHTQKLCNSSDNFE
jgi:hypothetical protein